MTSTLLLPEPSLQVLPSLALKIGLNEAIVLQQIHSSYLAKVGGQIGGRGQIEGGQDGRHWVDRVTTTYNTDTENTSEITLLLKPLPKTADVAARTDGEEEEEENEKEMMNQLFQIWNSTVQKKLGAPDVIQTPRRLSKLHLVFETIFDANPQQWAAYCQQIASLQFLMGQNDSGFVVTLDWAMHLDNARKILEGAIYDKPTGDRPVVVSAETFEATLTQHHADQGYPPSWTAICLALTQRLGQPVYRSWIGLLRPEHMGGTTARIQAPNPFIEDYVRRVYGDALLDAIQAHYPQTQSLHLFSREGIPS